MVDEKRIEELACEIELEYGYGDHCWVDLSSARAAIRKALKEDRAARPEAAAHRMGCPTCGCRLYKEVGPCAGEDSARNATRYEWIKAPESPFVVYYYGSRILGDDKDRRNVLTPELDALIDVDRAERLDMNKEQGTR